MRQSKGAPPSGSGYSAEPEPSSTVSAVPVSIPNAVRVTAADFNGRDWDGCPFDSVPLWLEQALRSGLISVKPDDRDYALWAVQTCDGVEIAEPGDAIAETVTGLRVYRRSWIAALALAAGSGTAETNEDSAQCGASQSGDAKQRNAQGSSHANQ